MQVFVKTLTGKTYTIDVEPDILVKALKEMVQELEGVPPCEQRLVCYGRQLEDERCIKSYNIRHEDSIHLITHIGMIGDLGIFLFVSNFHLCHTLLLRLICNTRECEIGAYPVWWLNCVYITVFTPRECHGF